jgi:flagellar FliL protein
MAEDRDGREEAQSKRSFLGLMILGTMVMILGVGGFMGWNLLNKGNAKESEASKPQAQAKEQAEKVIYPLESFIVNLMDNAGLGKRYLKVTIELEVGNKEDKKTLENHTTQLRDATLLLLSSQSFSEINTMEGKLDLKQALLSRINQILGEGMVQRLYFTEFVVQ